MILDAGREMKKLEIRNVKFFKNLVILKFDGIDNINDIEKYKGPRPVGSHERKPRNWMKMNITSADLLGMEVLLEDGSPISEP